MNGKNMECFCGTLTCIGGPNNNALCSNSSECPGGTCGNDTGCTSCNAAVTIDSGSSSSVIKNTAATESTIYGPFSPAITCNGQSSSRVQKITFIGSSSSIVVNCAQVDQNVFLAGASTATAVVTSGVANTDFVQKNYFENWVKAISVTGTKGVSVNHNLVSLRHTDNSGTGGIDVSSATSTSLQVQDNIIQGTSSTPILGNGFGTFARNNCDPLNSNAYCTAPAPPFVLP